MRYFISILTILFCSLTLMSCFDNSQKVVVKHHPEKINKGEQCHLCGMLITQFSGPKGELYRTDISAEASNTVKKFCSTRDLFSFYLDPENKRNVTELFVHDMSKSIWEKPDDNFFIDAKTAWYVVDSSQTGAMGKTLASFSAEKDALTFAKEYGGKVLSFSQIDMGVLF